LLLLLLVEFLGKCLDTFLLFFLLSLDDLLELEYTMNFVGGLRPIEFCILDAFLGDLVHRIDLVYIQADLLLKGCVLCVGLLQVVNKVSIFSLKLKHMLLLLLAHI
jgi:hypothetical protein